MVKAIILVINNTHKKTYRVAQYADSRNRLHPLEVFTSTKRYAQHSKPREERYTSRLPQKHPLGNSTSHQSPSRKVSCGGFQANAESHSASSGRVSGVRIRDLGLSTGNHGEPYLDDPTETHRLQLHLRVPGLASQRVGQTLSLQVLRAASRPIRTPRRNFAPISSSIRKHYRASARTRGMARSDSPRQEGGVSTTLPAHLAALSASTFLPEFRMLPGHKSGVIRAWNTP
jgi:hypothetical protein